LNAPFANGMALTLSGAMGSLIKLTGSGPGTSVKLRSQYLSSLMPSFRVSLAGVE
jgi:hypothetical protein